MKKTTQFIGIPSGDHVAFCFDVDRDTFIDIRGEEPEEYDQAVFTEGAFKIYPDDLILDKTSEQKKCKITFIVEEIGQLPHA